MSNKFKDVRIKKNTCYFFDNIINIKNFNPNNTKIYEKLYKNVLIYYIVHVTIKHLKDVKINTVNPSYLIFSKKNGYCRDY